MKSGGTQELERAAFASWNGRISPVFDVAGHVHLVAVRGGVVVHEADYALPIPAELRAARLAELGVAELVCGAISRSLHMAIQASGIRVTPFVAGEVPEVVQAWLGGRLASQAFVMPGCGRQRRRHSCRQGRAPSPPAAGMRRRRGGRGFARGGGRQAEQGNPVCVCPNCSSRIARRVGGPCQTEFCPYCGARMQRGQSQ